MSIVGTARAELFRFVRDRSAIFWAFAFFPIVYLFFTTTLDFVPATTSRGVVASMDPTLRAVRALGIGGNFIFHLFIAIGAATAYGAEYHHATWRLIGPRAARPTFFLAKTSVFVLLSAASLILTAIASTAIGWAMILLGSVLPPPDGIALWAIPAAFAVSVLELMVIGLCAALCVVVTRSRMAAAIVALFFSMGQVFAASYLTPPLAVGVWLASPIFAGDLIRTSLPGSGGTPPAPPLAIMLASGSLILWCCIFAGATVAVLMRQDWSRE